MRICLDITQSQYQGSGVGTYTYNLAKHLLSLNTKDHSFTFFGGSMRGYSKLKKISKQLKPQKSLIFPMAPTLMDVIFNRFHTLPIELFVGKTDIFHSSDWTQPKTLHAKSITTIHDLTIIKYPQYQHQKIISVHQRRLHWVKNEADAVITDSESSKKDIVKLLKIPDTKISVIPLAASTQYNKFAKLNRHKRHDHITNVRKKYRLNNPYYLTVGTAEPRKNHSRIVKAYIQHIAQTSKLIDLVIVGRKGWSKLQRIVPQQHKSKIKLLGFVDQTDLPALYRAANLLLYPSLYEGFGLPVLEAMTLGVPVVTSNKGSLSEVAGDAAVTVNPYSVASILRGINQAMDNTTKYSKLGIKQATKFSWQQTAVETLKVYEKIAQQS